MSLSFQHDNSLPNGTDSYRKSLDIRFPAPSAIPVRRPLSAGVPPFIAACVLVWPLDVPGWEISVSDS